MGVVSQQFAISLHFRAGKIIHDILPNCNTKLQIGCNFMLWNVAARKNTILNKSPLLTGCGNQHLQRCCRDSFLPTFSVQKRSAGPKAGRGVPTPPSLPLDSTHPATQQLRPPPAAETGSSCWGSGQQDASAAQGTKRMLGAATRRQGLLALDNPKEEVEAQKS